jgi:hypothetical protein
MALCAGISSTFAKVRKGQLHVLATATRKLRAYELTSLRAYALTSLASR